MNFPAEDESQELKDPRIGPRRPQADLVELKAVIARGDYEVSAMEIAKKMLSARVFHFPKHG